MPNPQFVALTVSRPYHARITPVSCPCFIRAVRVMFVLYPHCIRAVRVMSVCRPCQIRLHPCCIRFTTVLYPWALSVSRPYHVIRYLWWNCHQVNFTGPYWWLISIGSDNGWVSPGNKSLIEQIWPRYISLHDVIMPHWVNLYTPRTWSDERISRYFSRYYMMWILYHRIETK